MKISTAQNAILHSLLAQLEVVHEKAQRVSYATGARTKSSAELSPNEAQSLINDLKAERKALLGPMQGKLIGKLKELGYTIPNTGIADMDRIDVYIKNIGTRNPKKRGLFSLTKTELLSIMTQVNKRMTMTALAAKKQVAE